MKKTKIIKTIILFLLILIVYTIGLIRGISLNDYELINPMGK